MIDTDDPKDRVSGAPMIRDVAIVGAGFSGTLAAINLLRHDGPRVTLIERAPVAGQGLAYGAAHPGHLLNVRASNMSAFPDDRDHFVRWLDANGMTRAADQFVERRTYGRYLRESLTNAIDRAGSRLALVQGDAIDIEQAAGVSVRFGDGRAVRADAAVLAVGNLPPHAPRGLDPTRLSPRRWKGDPWALGVADGLDDTDTVLVVGTGLTMVDIVLLLETRGFGGRIVALSRRGLLPHRHVPTVGSWTPITQRPRGKASDLLSRVRVRADAIGWRNAVDELRPYTQAIWANATTAERVRFLRHLRPWWDVHRHRLAPPVAERLAELQASGRLEIVAGKTIGVTETEDGVELLWRRRGASEQSRLFVQRVINCTGPQGDLTRTTEPLLAALARRGAVRPDDEALGIDVDSATRVIGTDALPNPRLYALGPMTRGAFWEIVAVPDIRRQTWDLARRLANAHWVGGEGL